VSVGADEDGTAVGDAVEAGEPVRPAIDLGTSAGSRTEANESKSTPSRKLCAIRVGSSIASLVLPQPPGPVSVDNLQPANRPCSWAGSPSRPTRLVEGRGSTPDRLTPGTALSARVITPDR